MDDFLSRLKERVLLFDGGMGSMLIEAGLSDGEAPESWNLERPDALLRIHEAYIEAGADVIQTNTFGATGIKLASSSRGDPPGTAEVNIAAVRLARRAIEESGRAGVMVAGEIGPTGRFFPPMGDLTAGAARAAFAEQARALVEGGDDLILVETMYDLREAVEAVAAAKEAGPVPVVCEMTMERKKRGFFTLMGDTPAGAAEALARAGADMTGANCSISSPDMVDLAAEFLEASPAPHIFQPNAGSPGIVDGKAVYGQGPDEFASDMERVVRAGARAVGGCCGTTPLFIAALRKRLDAIGGDL